MDAPNAKDKILRLLITGLGWCFLLEALALTLGLFFTVKGSSLVGMTHVFDIPKPTFLRLLQVAVGCLTTAAALISYYLLAYAFFTKKQWGVPLAIYLNALLFAEELWRFLFPWKISREEVRSLAQDIETSGGYVLTEEMLNEIRIGINQTTTPLELAGRASLVILLIFVYLRRSHLATIMK